MNTLKRTICMALTISLPPSLCLVISAKATDTEMPQSATTPVH